MTKEKKAHPDRMETKKYCKFCKSHKLHKETKSVSYTHLEEIIRSSEESDRLNPIFNSSDEMHLSVLESNDKILKKIYIDTVSYTHLDVYKRQDGTNGSCSTCNEKI